MTIKLYQSPLSSATPVVWAVAELGLDHESITVDLKGDTHKQPAFLALNPMGQVPTLVDDGQAMFESSAIVIYLGEKYGVERGLWPEVGSAEHMVALTWTAWAAVTFGRTVHLIFVNSDERSDPAGRNKHQLANAKEQMARLMNIMNGHLDGRQYITGDRFTLVDCYAGALLGWSARMFGIDLASMPHLGGWVARCFDRDAARAITTPSED